MGFSILRKGGEKERLAFRRSLVAATLMLLTLAGFFSGGCLKSQNIKKYDLIGQLKKINQEVEGLNLDTSQLVEVLAAMDVKEGGLEESTGLLAILREKTQEQVNTSRELAEMVSRQRQQVATILSIAQEVLQVEIGLKVGTEKQVGIASKTLELVRLLYNNLRTFEGINRDIGGKMDMALELMRQM